MIRRICCLIAAVAFQFVLQGTNSGCTLDSAGICGDDCLRDEALSHVNSYVCSCSCSPAMNSREVRVGSGADDAVESTADGSVVVDGLDLVIGTDAVGHLVGVRFHDIEIPQGADIVSASVQFTAAADDFFVVSVEVVGQAADDAAPFSATMDNLSARPVTASSATWNPLGWNAEASGSGQRTPDLAAILQEIVDRPGWADGNALVLLISPGVGTGVRHAYSYDGQPLSAPQLIVQYKEPSSPVVGPQDLSVCVLPESNPNLDGGVPTDDLLESDCEGRVQSTLEGLALACSYPSDCSCTLQPGSQRFSDACDADCDENPVEADCSDFDPAADPPILEATNADGDAPVCLVHSPLAQGIYGRRSACAISGAAHVEIDGESADPSASGILYFLGDPCPRPLTCDVGMEARIDIGTVTFSNAFGSETFEELVGVGESVAPTALSMTGEGTFGAAECVVSARGRREDEARALVTANDDVIHITVGFGSTGPTCALNGTLIGSADPEIKRCESAGPDADKVCTDDSQCADDEGCSDGDCNCLSVGSSELVLGLNASGPILNQPPIADAGDDQVVECPALGILDGSASSDLDSNIALFRWLRGSRTGEEVGAQEMTTVQQGLGTETYLLRVIDAFGQADDDATEVTVVDTTPPVLSCSVTRPVLEQTNHVMLPVGLAARARDACEGELPVMVSVFGDEDDEMQTGDGAFSPDAKQIDIGTLRLRAERRGNGDGRVYLIRTEATDSSGNRGFNCCTVIVPHSKASAALASAQAQATAAEAFCLANAGMAPPGYFAVGDGPTIGPKP